MTAPRGRDWGPRAGRLAACCAFAWLVATFTGGPPYRHLPDDAATVKVSLRHPGQRLGACRERSAEELANLPPNMRAPMDCPRERSPVRLQVEINGERVIEETIEPKGLHRDGRASFYRRFTVPAGTVDLHARMSDSLAAEGFPYAMETRRRLAAGEVLVLDFDSAAGRFVAWPAAAPVSPGEDGR